jgi:probable HAF family extracellular repeat protein
MKTTVRVAVTALVALLVSDLAAGQTKYAVVKIPGSAANSLISINNAGQVVVNSVVSGVSQLSVWDRVHGSQSTGLVGNNSAGADINNNGQVAGAGDPNSSGVSQAFFWQPNFGAQWLGSLGGGLSAASGNNDAGAVVGLSYDAASYQHAFLWTGGGGMQDLTPGLTSIGGAAATAINSANQVVGYYFPNGTNDTVGFLWTQSGGLQNLGATGTLAYDINDAGTVVGKAPVTGGAKHAFSWTAGGGMQDLGTLGGSGSTALGINSHGWIVGNSLTTVSGQGLLHGFLWIPGGGMQDFTTLAGLAATQQTYSVGVNDSGVIAVSTNKGGSLLIPKLTATFVSSANPSKAGQAVTFTVTMSSIAGPPPDGETVQFVVSGGTGGSASLKNGVAQFTTSLIAAGSHVITAKYNGDTNRLATKFPLTQVVNP